MAFKITKDIIDTVLKKDSKEEKRNINNPKKKNLNPPVKINGKKSVKKIVPVFAVGNLIPLNQEFKALLQTAEAIPEDKSVPKEPKKEDTVPSTEVLSTGKRHFSIDSNAFGSRTKDFLASPIEEKKSFSTDSVRGNSAKYWSIDSKDKNFVFVEDELGSSSRSTTPYELDFYTPYNSKEDSDFGRTEQWVSMKSNMKLFENSNKKFSKDFWNSYIAGGEYKGTSKRSKGEPIFYDPVVKMNQIFSDHSYEMPLPFTNKEIEDFQVPRGSLVSKIDHEYNFYIEEYENTISRKKEVLDNTLPNMYVFMSELKNEKPNPEFKNFITLDDTLVTDEQLSRNGTSRNKFDIKTHPIRQYYDIYARQYTNAVEKGAVERLNKKFSNIVVPLEEIGLFNSFNESSEMFPMLVDITIGTDKTTTFAQILKDSKLTNSFITRLVNRHINSKSSTLSTEVSMETIVQRDDGTTKRKVSKFESVNKRTWDLAELVEGLRQDEEKLNNSSAIFLGNYDQEAEANSGPQFKFFKSLMFSIFQGKFQSLIKQKTRTIKEVMSGTPAYSETVLYRISKHEGNSNSQPIQNFWLPNSNEIDVLRFLDTQVKYSKRYFYKVWAYQLVIGSKYWYTDLDVQSYDHHASFKTHMEPSVMLVETLYSDATVRVMDKPPVPPDVDIIPYKGVDNEILFYLKGNVGDFEAEPVLIQSTDRAIFNNIRDSQKKDIDEKILFGSDDHPSTFQIFRIENKPRSYSDFTNNIRARVNTDISLESKQKATSASFVDSVSPNTKYYYIIRTIDIHGHVSNPSPIYEVEIINENGLIFPLIKCVDFDKENNETNKPARRFIQIVPNILQTLINEEKSGYEEAETAEDIKRKLHLGVTSDAVWDKRFKIRLTSKSTGKKIELNLGFEHKHSEKA